MGWAVHVARMGEGRGVYRVLVGKPTGKSVCFLYVTLFMFLLSKLVSSAETRS
jgi:hypothetical protein